MSGVRFRHRVDALTVTGGAVDGVSGTVLAPSDRTPALDPAAIEREIRARDADVTRPFGKDFQAAAIRRARAYLGDRLMRTARPHALLDPAAGPLIAVRLRVLPRKTLGGLHTDLSSRVLSPAGEPVPTHPGLAAPHYPGRGNGALW